MFVFFLKINSSRVIRVNSFHWIAPQNTEPPKKKLIPKNFFGYGFVYMSMKCTLRSLKKYKQKFCYVADLKRVVDFAVFLKTTLQDVSNAMFKKDWSP